jgi:hypothetical protein
MDSYNGFSGRERDRKYQEYKRLRALGLSIPAVPPCQFCGDPSSPVEPHSEDYAMPYEWAPPAEYMICRSCHGWIHKRFNRPLEWRDFQAHVRRGGYAREFATQRFAKSAKRPLLLARSATRSSGPVCPIDRIAQAWTGGSN